MTKKTSSFTHPHPVLGRSRVPNGESSKLLSRKGHQSHKSMAKKKQNQK